MNDSLLTIFNTYGKSHQVSKLLEEVGEFIETVMNEDKENIVKEMADVMVLLKQFQYYYDISDKQIEETMKFKINRQLKRIESENDEILDEEEFEEIRTIEYFADISDKELLDLHSEELVKIKNKINQLLKNQKKIIERLNKEN